MHKFGYRKFNNTYYHQPYFYYYSNDITQCSETGLDYVWHDPLTISQILESIVQIDRRCLNSINDLRRLWWVTQTVIINTLPDFLTLAENQLFNTIESIVTKKSITTVHKIQFSSLSISLHENEQLHDYLNRSKSSAQDCEFSYTLCHHDLS